MNKYLRTWLLGSNIGWLRDIGTRSVRNTHAKRHAAHQKATFDLLFPEGGNARVLNGPFSGMVYLNESVWGSITPRWIGSYESWLWPVVEEIIASSYTRIIDVGCAEGYYAVGFARALPGAEVFAYDLDPESRAQVARLWRLNGQPGKLSIHGLLDHRELSRLGTPGSLLVCDIEGGEMQLLNPALCSALTQMDILVEVHETGSTSVAANAKVLQERFQTSHEAAVIRDVTRATELQHVSHLDTATLKKATSEGRPYEQMWLWLKANRSPQ